MRTTSFRLTFAAVAAVALVACGGSATPDGPAEDDTATPPAAGICHSDSTEECDDTPVGDEMPSDLPVDPAGGTQLTCAERDNPDDCEIVDDTPGEQPASDHDDEQAAADAEALLGTAEADLADDVRIGRRGDEQMFLTEDYRLGRMTVELDEVDGVYTVVAVTVELEEGPKTFTN